MNNQMLAGPRKQQRPLTRTAVAVAVTLAAVTGAISSAQPALASDLSGIVKTATASCSNGACTVRLNWAETVALSQGRIPNINLGALTVPFRVLAYGHVLVAKGWVARGTCVAFTVNIRPWASQGMLGTPCR